MCLWGCDGGKQRGLKTSDISDILGLESVQTTGSLCPYPSTGLSASPCEPFDMMNPAAARGLCSLETSQIPRRVALSLAAVRWGLDYKQLHADKALEE